MSLNIDFSEVATQEKTSSSNSNSLSLNLEALKENSSDSGVSNQSSLALSLEDIAEIEQADAILEDFDIDEEDVDRLVAAIGAGIATESVINARMLSAYEDEITEARAITKTVVRRGKLVSKKVCPEGFKVQRDGTCNRMSSREVIAFKRRAKKAAKTRSRRKTSRATLRSRQRSMLVRGKNESRVNRVVPV